MKFKRIYLWYSLFVIVVLVWILVFYMPLSLKIRQKEQALNALKKELEIQNATIDSLIKNKGKNEMILASIKGYIEEIPIFERLPDFVKNLIGRSNRYGIVITDLNSVYLSQEKGSKTILLFPVFDITVKGRFMDIGNFLEKLTDYKAYKAIKKIELLYDEKEYPILTGRFVLEFKAWRRLPKLEIK